MGTGQYPNTPKSTYRSVSLAIAPILNMYTLLLYGIENVENNKKIVAMAATNATYAEESGLVSLAIS